MRSIVLGLFASPAHQFYAPKGVANACWQTRRTVPAWTLVWDYYLLQGFVTGNLTVAFAWLRGLLDARLEWEARSWFSIRMNIVGSAPNWPRFRERNVNPFALPTLHHSALP
jgi:hypothetical protein